MGAGRSCARSMSVPNSSPVLDKNVALMGPGILSSTGVGSGALPDSNSVLDKFQSAILI